MVLCLTARSALSTPLRAQGNVNLPPDLQALINEALKANAEIKQMASCGAAKETIRPAGALEDPEAASAYEPISPPTPGPSTRTP